MIRQLYHYCSNKKAIAILSGRSIRMSDIQKSNDYKELSLFFPMIFDCLEHLYAKKPFYFRYANETGRNAFYDFLDLSYRCWKDRFSSGDFSNLVLCLSEDGDSLSQWRGYADNGQGCCIGFSQNQLEKYCDNSKGVLRLEKVTYLVEEGIYKVIKDESSDIFHSLEGLRKWIVEEMTHNDDDPDTDGLLEFNFDGMLRHAFTNSLKYKSYAFHEEKEWRMFLSNQAYKNPDWLCGKTKKQLTGPSGFSETIDFLRNKINFHATDDDLIPYYPINFVEFSRNPVASVCFGPKNKVRFADMELFLRQNQYEKTTDESSKITYH